MKLLTLIALAVVLMATLLGTGTAGAAETTTTAASQTPDETGKSPEQLAESGGPPPLKRKRSAAEWAKLASNDKVRELMREEDQLTDSVLGDKFNPDKPGMIFVDIEPGIYSSLELKEVARNWQELLQTAGMKVTVFESGASQWCVVTHRASDIAPTIKFLLEQPFVMKTTYENRDRWVLPKYQKQMVEYNKKRDAERKERERDMMRRRKRAEEEEARKKKQQAEEEEAAAREL